MSLSASIGVLQPERDRSDGVLHLGWYFAFFVISGFCGLVYEVIWVRLAMASFGVTTALASIVLSIFMGGLGLGSWSAGILTRRFSKASAARGLHLYALAEVLIGCSALLVPMELRLGRNLILHMGSVGSWQTWGYYLLAGLWLMITLLPWCTFLGSTFPLLMSVILKTCGSASKRSFSFLYLANVLGALLGTAASAFVLIEFLGFQGTLWVAAALNAILALLAFVISLRLRAGASEQGEIALPLPTDLYGRPRWFSLALLFSTGLVSMGSEVIWIRQFTPFLGNLVYAFALIVGTYLAATFLGARDYRRWARSNDLSSSKTTWSLIAASALIPLIGADPLLHLTTDELSGLRIISIIFFCALTGFMTPLLVDAWSGGRPDKAGVAYAFNILGCIVGPLIASFVLEPWLGERWSMVAFSLPLFGLAGFLAFGNSVSAASNVPSRRPRTTFVVAVIVGILLVSFSDDFETEFKVREVRRDYSATVIATGTGFNRDLRVNGAGMTVLTPITKYIADLPLAFMSRPPRNGLVICFGMGTTFRSMLSWGIPTTAVDLIPSVPRLFPYFHSDAQALVRSPLAKIVIDDGRRFLDGSDNMYDVIVVDPPPPVPAAGSSLLYSREFYRVVKRHLNRDGILQMWYPSANGDEATTASITKALVESFPHVRAFKSYDGQFGIHFLASMEAIPDTTGTVLASRMPASAAKDFMEWGPASDPASEFDMVTSKEISVQTLIAEQPRIPALSDDEPINEYFLLRHVMNAPR